jgi:shikimate dehydrogenase
MTNNSAPPDRYGLVGHPVEHSRSPFIHTLFARQTDQRISYELLDAAPAAFETAVRGFGAAGGRGLNVTVPHKEAAFTLMDEISHAARVAGAVNTISIVGKHLRGDNTDGIGFVRDVTVNQGQELADRTVILFGAGGAARGIVGPVLAEKPAKLVIANRSRQRAVDLAAHFGHPPEMEIVAFDQLDTLPAFDVLVNASSAGLKGEATPFPGSLVSGDSFCYDMVYSRNDTPFVSWANAHGAGRAVQGWGMLVEQAAQSFYVWRGVMPVTAPILKQLLR